ncbi:cellulose-binding family II [Fusarium beomiforme]|uniref:Cellulose-binding family II n=1 Tax=Fusarium beomiforme TaxID=44412 RepID=A0A9P5DVU8_9HYPO|nr:cellulose-binding family II [Fusarium beomiforme]
MRFASAAGLMALATSTVAHSNSAKSDLDGSVWKSLTSVKSRSWASVPRNRPTKRQSGWNPPSDLVTPLKEVWDHEVKTYSDALGFKNYGWDQVIAGKGQLNVCVRWESSASVTAEQRTKVASALQDSYSAWMKWVSGWDNFPYEDVKINVVGWAVKDKSLLQGSTEGLDIYTDTDAEGIPQCSEKCGRFFHQDGDYSSCPGGAERHYDNSLWLTDGMEGGAGGDWGQRIGREYFMELLGTKDIHILEHEIGHTFALDDFYDWTPTGQTKFIMLAGSATEVTEFDGWMLRNWWYELSRERGWQSTTSSSAPKASSTEKAVSAVSSKAVSTKATASKPTSTTIKQTATETLTKKPVNENSSSATAATYAQCGGGASYTGPTKCASGLKCVKHSEWYSQCL